MPLPDDEVVPDVPEVSDVLPEAEDELEPSRGCAASLDDVDERECFELRPCAFDRLAFLWMVDELELVSSLVFPAIAASSLFEVLVDDESGWVAFELSAVPVASEDVRAVDDAWGGVCCAAALVAIANAPATAMSVIFICTLLCPPRFRWGRGLHRATVGNTLQPALGRPL